jgi:hypothetical protein
MLTVAGRAETQSPGNKTPAPQPGLSPFNPASVGVPINTIIECGTGYTSHELYDTKITLLQVLRGEKAWERIKAASTSNESPNVGFEYILVHIRFEYFARGSPGDCSHELSGAQFTAFSGDGMQYETPSVEPPNPKLGGKLYSGDSAEGWLAFQVEQDDSKPLMTFTAEPAGAIEHGGGIWFQLY